MRLRQEMQQHVGIVGVQAHRRRERLQRLRRPAGVHQGHADADVALGVVGIELDRAASAARAASWSRRQSSTLPSAMWPTGS